MFEQVGGHRSVLSFIIACCSMMALLTCGELVMAQTTILSDDFDEIIWNPTPGTLTGREAPTGQTWVDFDHWAAGSSLKFGPTFGTVDNGAGGGDDQGNSIPLGTTLTTGTVHLGLDFVVNDRRIPQIWFVNDVTRRGFSYQWDAYATGSPIKFEFANNIKNPDGGFVNQSVSTGMAPGAGALHVDLDIDLDANTLDVRWNDVNGPTSGSKTIGTWREDEVVVEPNRLHLYQNTQCCGSNGYDNVLVDIDGVVVPPTEFTWVGGAGGNWNLNSNWTPGGIPGDGPSGLSSDKKVIFGNSISSTSTVFTDLPRTVNSIQFDNTARYIIGGGGGVNLIASANPVVLPTIDVADGNHEFQTAVNLLDNTTANVPSASTLTFNNALNLNANTLTKTGAGDMAINNVLNSGGGTVNCDAGTCSGEGTIGGDLNNNGGTVSPGNSPGRMAVDGDFSQAVDGTLFIELAGTDAGSQHDVMQVDGEASLGGALEVSLLDGFEPQFGDTFDILDLASLTGEFDKLLLPGLAAGLAWDTTSLYADGGLSVVPEPSTFVLAVAAWLFLLAPTWRRR
jgi:hypothetical protein